MKINSRWSIALHVKTKQQNDKMKTWENIFCECRVNKTIKIIIIWKSDISLKKTKVIENAITKIYR
jgi:hypothetical protein